MSCPYIKFNFNKMREECEVNHKPTNSAMICDFGYEEECKHYKQQIKREKIGEQISLFQNKSN